MRTAMLFLLIDLIAAQLFATTPFDNPYSGVWRNENGTVMEITPDGGSFLIRIGSDIEDRQEHLGAAKGSDLVASGSNPLTVHQKGGRMMVSGAGAFKKLNSQETAGWRKFIRLRGAQCIACLAAASRASGYSGKWTDLKTAVADLRNGVTVQAGSRTLRFRTPRMTQEEEGDAMQYLRFDPDSSALVIFTPPADPGLDSKPGHKLPDGQ